MKKNERFAPVIYVLENPIWVVDRVYFIIKLVSTNPGGTLSVIYYIGIAFTLFWMILGRVIQKKIFEASLERLRKKVRMGGEGAQQAIIELNQIRGALGIAGKMTQGQLDRMASS